MRIFKPMSLGLLHKPYRQFGRDRLVIAALGFFRLGEPVARFLTENLQWPAVLEALPAGEPLDAVMPKPRAEYLLAGSAHAPRGEPVARMQVAVTLAGRCKRVEVCGDRQWRYGLLPWHGIDDPRPFAQMPLTYERAYGGPGHPGNPLGVGYTGSRLGALVGSNAGPMPNIHYPDQEPRDHHREHPPAGFMPLDIRWQPRAGLLGSYDRDWLEQDFPGLARDLDWAAFNTAPVDQRFGPRFAGDEPYRLEGLHPEDALIEGRLPAMRARALVLREGQAVADSEMVELGFDTVWFFPASGLGVAIYRGGIDIADSEAADLAALLLGYEQTAAPARSVDHYRQALALRMDPEGGLRQALNDAPLVPVRSADEISAGQQRRELAEADYLDKRQAQLDEAAADFWQQSGRAMPADYVPPQAELPPLGLVPAITADSPDLDLTALMDKAAALAADAEQQREQGLAELAAQRDGKLKPLRDKAAAQQPDLTEQCAQAEARAARPAVGLAAPGAQPAAATAQPELLKLLAEVQGGRTELSADERRLLEDSRARLPALQRQARRMAPQAVPAAPDPAVARHLGQRVRAWLAEGQCLAGRDLSGADLAGVDLAGADLREVQLEHADLSGARLDGANLAGAVLAAARLDDADLAGADLRGANLSGVTASGAGLREACLDGALIMGGDLDRADLSGASLDRVVAQRVSLRDAILDGVSLVQALLHDIDARRSSWRGARLRMTIFNLARLDQADLSASAFDGCVLMQLQGDRSRWQDARLVRVFMGGGASLKYAGLGGLRASHSSWRDGDLRGIDLSGAGLLDCDLGGADLGFAQLAGTVLSRSVLIRSRLCDSDARGAQFYQALLRKADLSRADLRDANLVQANLFEARLDDTDLRGVQPDPLGRAA